jgi:hypothetical protein
MKFSEAIEKLKSGAKVSRRLWGDGIYFFMKDKEIKSFQPRINLYQYDESIMISDGWIVEGNKEEFKFCDLIPLLQQGSRAKWKGWEDMVMYLDPLDKVLVLESLYIFPFTPDFDSFTADDWVVLND